MYDERVVTYDAKSARDLSSAYAIAVHKSQGSEFSFVFVASTQHYVMMKKALVYVRSRTPRRSTPSLGRSAP